MTTKTEMLNALKIEHPTLRSGSDETGYTELTPTEYEATLSGWADARLSREAKEAEAERAATAKAALLAKLGITADEAKLLLGGN